MEEELTVRHDFFKHKIADACRGAGFRVEEEHRGRDWRADVFATDGNSKVAFEVQITRQSLTRTKERQQKYLRDGMLGCWLFEKEPPGSSQEMIDLPLFKLLEADGEVRVSLKGRKELSIGTFVSDFLNSKIQFRESVVTTARQKVELWFVEMKCWKCGVVNNIYFANGGYHSSCNTRLSSQEMLWASNLKEYHPEIVSFVREYAKSNSNKNLLIGPIERRFSETVQDSYMSFGCARCNSIFGDWFVHEARIESLYGDGVVDKVTVDLDLDKHIRIDLPHWCHPGDGEFCN